MFDNTQIQHVDLPEYLGVTLGRTLTYKPHLEKVLEVLVRKLPTNVHCNDMPTCYTETSSYGMVGWCEWRREVTSGSFDRIVFFLLDSIVNRTTPTANHHPSFVKNNCKISN
jgi:hypothetical protein